MRRRAHRAQMRLVLLSLVRRLMPHPGGLNGAFRRFSSRL